MKSSSSGDSDGNRDVYRLTKFKRSNQSNCYNQKPIVFKGDHVESGEVIADGPVHKGRRDRPGKEPADRIHDLGGDTTTRMPYCSASGWVQDDVYTSVHIEEYEAESRDTKLGPEEITRDVPGVGEDALKDLA